MTPANPGLYSGLPSLFTGVLSITRYYESFNSEAALRASLPLLSYNRRILPRWTHLDIEVALGVLIRAHT
jgi:hypothetical protein